MDVDRATYLTELENPFKQNVENEVRDFMLSHPCT